MARLARSGHGRCVTAPGIVTGPAEDSMPPPSTPTRPVLATSAPAMTPPGRSLRARRRRLPLAVAAMAAIVLAALGPALRNSTVSADGVPGLPDVTFFGRGYGHGVGMSQYGARGRALAGQLAPEILAHYYPKTTLGTKGPGTPVRILLLTGFKATAARPLTVVGLVGGWTIGGIATTFPANARLTLGPTAAGATTWNLKVVSAAGAVLARKVVSGDVYVRPVNAATVLQLVSKATTTNVYRGLFRIRLTTTALVVNHLAVDQYLRGVVPLEMPSTWPTEALRAQAIAARSYALFRIHPATGLFDVYDDTRSQVYRGKRVETSPTNLAIGATAGTVLLSGTALVNALFHSADGGWTENNENVFVNASGTIVAGAVSYLRGSSDRGPDGTSYDQASPYATWQTATYSAAALSAILAKDPRTNVGLLSVLDLTRRGVSGRLISVTLAGDLGTKTVSGEVFRAAFNAGRPTTDPALRSTLFDLAPIP
jgi:SpoIID/LytB domain protein